MSTQLLKTIADLSITLAQRRFGVSAAQEGYDPSTLSHQLDAWALTPTGPAPAVPVVSMQGTDAIALAKNAAAFSPDVISFATNVTRGAGEQKVTSRLVMVAERQGQMILAEFDIVDGVQASPARFVARQSREYAHFLDSSMGKVMHEVFHAAHKSAQQTLRNVRDDSVRWMVYGSTDAMREHVQLATSTLGWTGVVQSSDLCAINAAPSQEDAAAAGRSLPAYNEAFALDALIASLSVLTTSAEFEHQAAQRAAGQELARA